MIPIDLSQEKQHEPVKGYKVKFMHTDNMTFAFWDIIKGYSVPRHSHPNRLRKSKSNVRKFWTWYCTPIKVKANACW